MSRLTRFFAVARVTFLRHDPRKAWLWRVMGVSGKSQSVHTANAKAHTARAGQLGRAAPGGGLGSDIRGQAVLGQGRAGGGPGHLPASAVKPARQGTIGTTPWPLPASVLI